MGGDLRTDLPTGYERACSNRSRNAACIEISYQARAFANSCWFSILPRDAKQRRASNGGQRTVRVWRDACSFVAPLTGLICSKRVHCMTLILPPAEGPADERHEIPASTMELPTRSTLEVQCTPPACHTILLRHANLLPHDNIEQAAIPVKPSLANPSTN